MGRLSRDPVYQAQALTLVKVFPEGPESPFSLHCSSHTYWNKPLTEDSQIHRFRTFLCEFSGHQPQTLYPSLPQRKQQQAKNNASIKGLFLEERIGVASHKGDWAVLERDWGHLGVGMAWNWINKWRNPLFVAWAQWSQRKARGVATMRDPSKP